MNPGDRDQGRRAIKSRFEFGCRFVSFLVITCATGQLFPLGFDHGGLSALDSRVPGRSHGSLGAQGAVLEAALSSDIGNGLARFIRQPSLEDRPQRDGLQSLLPSAPSISPSGPWTPLPQVGLRTIATAIGDAEERIISLVRPLRVDLVELDGRVVRQLEVAGTPAGDTK